MNPPTTFFSASRFVRLARSHWAEQRRGYGLFLLVVAALYALMLLIFMAMDHGRAAKTGFQSVSFYACLLFSGAVFASLYFAALRRPESALLLLMRPATTTEKWALAAVFVLLAYPVAYGLAITAIHAVASVVGYQWDLAYVANLTIAGHQPSTLPDPADYTLFVPFIAYAKEHSAIQRNAQWAWLQIYVGLTGLALRGSIFCRKVAGLKTAVLAFVVFLLTLLWGSLFSFRPDLLAWWELDKLPERTSSAAMPLVWSANGLFWLAVPCLLWLCALLALQERDLT